MLPNPDENQNPENESGASKEPQSERPKSLSEEYLSRREQHKDKDLLPKDSGAEERSLKSLGGGLLKNAKRFGEMTVGAVGSTVAAAGKAARATFRAADEALERLGYDPDKERSVPEIAMDMALGLFPFVDQTKEYADARKKFRKAQAEDDPELLQEARRDCLLLCSSLGLDVVTLGAASRAPKVGRLIARAMRGVRMAQQVGKAAKFDIDVVSPVADQALRQNVVSQAMDYLLSMTSTEATEKPGTEGKSEPDKDEPEV